jgi:hypothetical protein
MKYLSYSSCRVRPWTEHKNFPVKAVEWERDSYKKRDLHIYAWDEENGTLTLIPKEEWPTK